MSAAHHVLSASQLCSTNDGNRCTVVGLSNALVQRQRNAVRCNRLLGDYRQLLDDSIYEEPSDLTEFLYQSQ